MRHVYFIDRLSRQSNTQQRSNNSNTTIWSVIKKLIAICQNCHPSEREKSKMILQNLSDGRWQFGFMCLRFLASHPPGGNFMLENRLGLSPGGVCYA